MNRETIIDLIKYIFDKEPAGYDYFELREDYAIKILYNAVNNIMKLKYALSHRFNHNGKKYTPAGFDINSFECDGILSLIDGEFDFSGSIDLLGFEGPLKLDLHVKNFNVVSIDLTDMLDYDEMEIEI